jgi:hypothetical protein
MSVPPFSEEESYTSEAEEESIHDDSENAESSKQNLHGGREDEDKNRAAIERIAAKETKQVDLVKMCFLFLVSARSMNEASEVYFSLSLFSLSESESVSSPFLLLYSTTKR